MNRKIYIVVLVIILSLICSCNNMNDIQNQEFLENMVGRAAAFEIADVENVKITAYKLNIRSGAGTNHSVVGVLNQNQVVEVVGKIGTWYVIHMKDDLVGCVSSKYAKPVLDNEPRVKNITYELTTQEKQMIDLINKERTKNNLKPLIVDWEVSRVARFKSKDMVENNYFSHNSPTYGSPFNMLTNFGINYMAAGENIAGNSTVERAHTSLMNSEGHRNNILSKNFTHVGVGIVDSPKYGLMFTQQFIGK